MPLGMSFAPRDPGTTDRSMPAPAPIQEAIRVMSLQMPRVAGANAPTPGAMLAGMGGGRGMGFGGPTSNPIIEQLLRALFGGQQSAGPGLPGAPSMPSRPVFPGFTFGSPPPQPGPMPPSMPQPQPGAGGGMSTPEPPMAPGPTFPDFSSWG